MKKYIKTTARNAVEKGLIKKGDRVWIEVEVYRVEDDSFFDKYSNFFDRELIRITKPEPKVIDFEVAGKVLKGENGTIIMTTGFLGNINSFSGYVLESKVYNKGYTSNNWIIDKAWTDITDTYNK